MLLALPEVGDILQKSGETRGSQSRIGPGRQASGLHSMEEAGQAFSDSSFWSTGSPPAVTNM